MTRVSRSPSSYRRSDHGRLSYRKAHVEGFSVSAGKRSEAAVSFCGWIICMQRFEKHGDKYHCLIRRTILQVLQLLQYCARHRISHTGQTRRYLHFSKLPSTEERRSLELTPSRRYNTGNIKIESASHQTNLMRGKRRGSSENSIVRGANEVRRGKG